MISLDPNNNKTPQISTTTTLITLETLQGKDLVVEAIAKDFSVIRLTKKSKKKTLLQPSLMVVDVLTEVITGYVITEKNQCVNVLANFCISAFRSI